MRLTAASPLPPIQTLRVLLVTIWAGSIWSLGYLVAPVLFATLSDRVMAGTIAGSMFRVGAYVSLVCAVLLMALLWVDRSFQQRRTVLYLAAAMLVCVLVGYFGLQPFMAALKESAVLTGGVMDEATRARFGLLHGVASLIYLLQSLLAVALVLKARQGD